MRKLTINHPAVWLGVVLLSILGFMWYGPLFGETWMGMEGLNPTEVEANPPGAGVWITNFIQHRYDYPHVCTCMVLYKNPSRFCIARLRHWLANRIRVCLPFQNDQ